MNDVQIMFFYLHFYNIIKDQIILNKCNFNVTGSTFVRSFEETLLEH